MNELWTNLHKKNEFIPPNISLQFHEYIIKENSLTKIIDIGCGNGRNIKYVSHLYPGKELYAVDIYPNITEKINSSLIESSISDMRECPIRNEYLSHAISWRVLHHHEEKQREEAMDEIRRILCVGGVLLMAVRSVNDWSYGIGTQTEKNSFVVLDKSELPRGMTFFS
jgi:trans-aconitate methyltransferase